MADEDVAVVETINDEVVADDSVVATVPASDDQGPEPVTDEFGEEIEANGEDADPDKPSLSKKEVGEQKRIDELTKIRRDLERDRDYYKNLSESAPRPNQNQEAPQSAPARTLADFEYDEDQYREYITQKAVADARAESERTIGREKAARAKAEFTSREADFSKDLIDYNSVTRNQDLPITEYMLGTLHGSEKGPEVLYYLGKHPDLAAKMARMDPLQMAREIGILESTKLAVKKPAKVSNAPPVTPKLETNAKVSVSPEKMTDKQFAAWRKKTIANRT